MIGHLCEARVFQKLHQSTKYGQNFINYVHMGIPLAILFEIEACSYIAGHIVNKVISKAFKPHVYHFSWQLLLDGVERGNEDGEFCVHRSLLEEPC